MSTTESPSNGVGEHNAPKNALASKERIIVGLSAGPGAKSLLSAAQAYVSHFGGQWLAVSVQTPETLSLKERQMRSETLSLARQLGAEILLANGVHVGRTLLRLAREHKATLLILGKPAKLSALRFWGDDSPVLWLQRNSATLRLLLLPTEPSAAIAPRTFAEVEESAWREYAWVLGVASLATGISALLEPLVGYWSVALIYLLTVTLTGVSFRRGPTLFLATLSALLWNLLFIPPRFTLYINHPQDFMMFSMFFAVALVVGQLTTRLRERERMEHRLELRATALYQLTRNLAAATSTDEVVEAVVFQIHKVFNLESAVFLRNAEATLIPTTCNSQSWVPSPSEIALIHQAFESQHPLENNESAVSKTLCLPLTVSERVEGVLAVRLESDSVLDPSQRELLDAFASQLAIVSEIQRLAQEQRATQLRVNSERLQKTLFDSVSHELKTPLAAIRVALDQPAVNLDEIRRANDRLHRSVDHLLSATRIESGQIKPKLEWSDPVDLIYEALALSNASESIELTLGEMLPLIRVDAGLTTQALATLLENAMTHGASSQPPQIRLFESKEHLCFEVADFGPGLREGTDEKVFEKFFRLPGALPGGLGLGLAIARQFIEVQGGTLQAHNRSGGGAVFTLKLPIGGQPQIPE
jgi:two-component system sensor histidine kinase KdpD